MLKQLVVLAVAIERRELLEAGMHRPRPRVDRGVVRARRFVDPRRICRKLVPEAIEVDALASLDQSLGVRSSEIEVPGAFAVRNRVPRLDAREWGIHQHQTFNLVGVLRGVGVRNHVTDVVSHNCRAVVAERPHDSPDVRGFRLLLVPARRMRRQAHAAQVGNDHGVRLGQLPGERSPHVARVAETVNENDGRTRPAGAHEDVYSLRDGDSLRLESRWKGRLRAGHMRREQPARQCRRDGAYLCVRRHGASPDVVPRNYRPQVSLPRQRRPEIVHRTALSLRHRRVRRLRQSVYILCNCHSGSCVRWSCRASIVVVAVWFIAPICAAQIARRLTRPPEFTVDQWTTADGLPQNSVNAIAQTPDGYVWVGTFGGLARFDGLRFRVAERVDDAGHHADRVLSLAVAPDSSLWIGTENGLLQYRAGHFKRFTQANGLPDHEIRALHFDRAGTLWVGTEHGGAARYQKGIFVAVSEADGAVFREVVSIVEDRTGVLWLNSQGNFLTVEQGQPTVARALQFGGHGFEHMLLEDRDGSLWFRLADGVARMRQGHMDEFRWGFGPIQMTQQQRPGRYWLGTFGEGVLEFVAEGAGHTVSYPLNGGASDYSARTLLDGRDGILWVGTATSGLLRFRQNLFTTYRTRNGLSNDVITPVMETRDGEIWAGTNCGGVNVIDATRETVRSYLRGRPGPGSDPCVFALAQDSAGVVWAGTYGGGLTRIENGKAQRVGGLGVLRDSTILALYTDRRGTLWVGTGVGGLAEVKDGRVRRVYTTRDGLVNNSVRTITQTRDGTLWIGTLGGVSHLGAHGR